MGVLTTLAWTAADGARTASYSSSDLEDVLTSSTVSAGLGYAQFVVIWTIISLILAVVGGFLIYFLFVKRKVNPVNKFWAWMKKYLRFEKIVIEDILKIAYIILALYITLYSFSLIGVSFLGFLGMIILGNLALRVVYELTMIMVMIWSNTTQIKCALVKEETKEEVKEATVVKEEKVKKVEE